MFSAHDVVLATLVPFKVILSAETFSPGAVGFRAVKGFVMAEHMLSATQWSMRIFCIPATI